MKTIVAEELVWVNGLAYLVVTFVLMGLSAGCTPRSKASPAWEPIERRIIDELTLEMQVSPVTVSLRGVFAVDENICWVSGPEGTVLRTVDGGATWDRRFVEDAPTTDFRDVHAFDADRAVVMGIGSPGVFYRTEDGGKTWRETFRDERPEVFFDGMDFWDDGERGLAFSDPINGKLFIVHTADGGASWSEVDPAGIPAALKDEAGFAGSGTGIVTLGEGIAMIGLGGQTPQDYARIFMSNDYGRTWSLRFATILSSASAGIFSLAASEGLRVVAVGGDYLEPDGTESVLMVTRAGPGFRWRSSELAGPSGYRSVVAFIPGTEGCIAAGPNGMDVSEYLGFAWERFSDTGFHSLSFGERRKGRPAVGWLVGSEGRIARIILK